MYTTSAVDWKTGKVIAAPLDKPRLKEGAVPCVFPNYPSYLNNQSQHQREAPTAKRMRIEAAALQAAIDDSIKSASVEKEKFTVTSFDELKTKLKYVSLNDNWNVILKSNCAILVYLNVNTSPHQILCIIVNEELKINIYLKGIEIKIKNVPEVLHDVIQLDMLINTSEKYLIGEEENKHIIETIFFLLDFLQNKNDKARDKDKTIRFLKSQIGLCVESREHHRFDSETMIIASMLLFISPHAYKFLRSSGLIVLPHPNTIKNLCSNVNVNPQSSCFLSYIKEKQKSLKSNDCYITVMVDEIHIKPYVDYKGGNIVGVAYDSTNLASTAHVFMIQSLCSSFKDVVHILPVNKMDGNKLFEIIKTVILGLETIGFKVVAIVTDNNKINHRAVSEFAIPESNTSKCNQSVTPSISRQGTMLPERQINTIKKIPKKKRSFVYPHPSDKSRPLFYINDTVHIFKCIRNNWLNLKNYRLTFCFPDFYDLTTVRYASFEAIRDVYKIESDKLLKFGYGLSLKALWPSTFERQNVKLVMQIFNDDIENSLLELGPSEHIENYEDTAKFINIIKKWWNVVNVKSPVKGLRLRNSLQQPITNDSLDERYMFLDHFLQWVNKWGTLGDGGKLTSETHEALKLTTYGLLEMTDYCINELKFTYLLLGKVQTDALEDRFGRYRQLSGSQYHVSLRQILESEKKIRLLSLLDLSLKSGSDTTLSNHKIIIKNLSDSCESSDVTFQDLCTNVYQNVNVSDQDLKDTEPDLPVLTYIAGYCCFSVIKKFKCDNCKQFLTIDKELANDVSDRLIIRRDRGGLRFPRKSAVLFVTYSFVILKKLLAIENFLNEKNQRSIACTIIWQKILNYDIIPDSDCEIHPTYQLWQKIIFVTVNIILNNYCKVTNNNAAECVKVKAADNKRKRNRKLETLTNKPSPKSSQIHEKKVIPVKHKKPRKIEHKTEL